MNEIVIRDIDDELLHDLKETAAGHGISVEEESKRILQQVLQRKRKLHESIQEADEFARQVGSQTIDSTEFIREDREWM